MSLMGYEEKDIEAMIESIIIARRTAPEAIQDNLTRAIDFLDGMLVEGRI